MNNKRGVALLFVLMFGMLFLQSAAAGSISNSALIVTNSLIDVSQISTVNTVISNAIATSFVGNWVYNAPGLSGISPGNTILFTIPSSASGNVLTLTVNAVSANTLILTFNTPSTTTSNSLTLTGTGNSIIGTWTFNAFARSAQDSTNSILTAGITITINAMPTLSTPIQSNTLLDFGQSVTYNTVLPASAGTGPFTVNLMTGTTVVNTIVVQYSTGAQIITFAANIPAIGAADTFNVVAVDTGATTKFTFNSISNAVTVNAIPTLSTPLPSNIILDFGQYVVYNTILPAGVGTGPFTVNLMTGTTVVNTVIIQYSASAQTITFAANIPAVGASDTFNVVAVDTKTTTPFAFNSVSNVITVNIALGGNTLTPSSATIDQGSTEVLTGVVTSGSSPYTYNFMVVNTITGNVVASRVVTNTVTSNSFTFTMPSTANAFGTLSANLIVTDSATTNMITITKTPITVSLALAAGAAGPAAVNLGMAGNFAILSKTGITDSAGHSVITGNVAASPITGAAIGVSCTQVTGNVVEVDAAYTGGSDSNTVCALTNPTMLTTAVSNMQAAYTDAAGRTDPTATELGSGNIGGMTLAPGLYKWSTGVTIPTSVTLSGGPNDVWIFQISGGLTMSSAVAVLLTGGAQPQNIFWQVAGSTVALGTTSGFNGIILGGPSTAITMPGGYAILNGRALSQTSVTLGGYSTVTAPTGGVALPAGATTTLLASNAIIEQGQTEVLTANMVGGSGSYTYNFMVVNTVTGNVVASIQVGGVSLTYNTFTFTMPSTANAFGTLSANVIITDSGQGTTSTKATITAYKAPTISSNMLIMSVASGVSNSVVYGNYITANVAAIVGGSGSFSYTWAISGITGSPTTTANSLVMPNAAYSYPQNTLPLAVGTYTYNVYATDTGTTTAYTTPIASNVLVINTNSSLSAPAVIYTDSVNGGTTSTTVSTGSSHTAGYYDAASISFNGMKTINNQVPWTVYMNGALLSTTASLYTWPGETAKPGTYAFTFNNVGNSNYTSETFTVTLIASQQSTSGGSGSGTGVPYTTTVATTSTTVSTVPTTTTITSVQTVNGSVNVTASIGAPVEVNVTGTSSTVTVYTSSSGSTAVNVAASDATSNSAPAPANFTKLSAVNITLSTNVNITVNATMSYPCSLPSGKIAPYILKNGTWLAIEPFTVNKAACTETFAVPKDPIVGLFENNSVAVTTTILPTTVAPTTTVMPTPSVYGSTYMIAAIVVVIIVVVVAYALLKGKRKGSRGA